MWHVLVCGMRYAARLDDALRALRVHEARAQTARLEERLEKMESRQALLEEKFDVKTEAHTSTPSPVSRETAPTDPCSTVKVRRVPPADEPTLVRVHKRDLLGDIFDDLCTGGSGFSGSSGQVLRESMRQILNEGRGAIVHIRSAVVQ